MGQLKNWCFLITVFLVIGLFTVLIAPTEAFTPEGKTIIISIQDGVAFQDGITTSVDSPNP